MDFPWASTLPLHISSWGRYSSIYEFFGLDTGGAGGSQTWFTANSALYYPIWLPFHYPVVRMFWCNGSVAGGNWDVGMYSQDGNQIWHSGSTAGSVNNSLQYVTPTSPFVLSPGYYYLAVAHDSTTANHGAGYARTAQGMSGVLSQGSAFPLPATTTPVRTGAGIQQICGFTRTASGF